MVEHYETHRIISLQNIFKDPPFKHSLFTRRLDDGFYFAGRGSDADLIPAYAKKAGYG